MAALAKDEQQALYIRDYMRTKFFRFLVSLRKITQDNKSDIFSFVPSIQLNKKWNDELLFSRYEIDDKEISFIDSMVRTMEWKND